MGFFPPFILHFPRARTHLFAFPSNLFFSSPPFFVWTARAGNQVGPAEFIYFYGGRGNWRNRCESGGGGGGGGRCSRWLMPTLPSCADVGGGFSLRLKSVIIAPKTAVYHHQSLTGQRKSGGNKNSPMLLLFPLKMHYSELADQISPLF